VVTKKAAILAALAVVIFDQATKAFIDRYGLQWSWGYVALRVFQNTGGPFSLDIDYERMLVLSAIALGLLAIMAYLLRPTVAPILIFMLMAGGASNIIDRLRLGYVIDPFQIGPVTLNLADIAILSGLLAISALYFRQPDGAYRNGDVCRISSGT
jgi:signal peptidase II